MNSLIHSHDGSPLNVVQEFISQSREEIVIFSPYIQTSLLEILDIPEDVGVTIVTTLSIRDIWSGVSDINLYPYCRANSISLYINNSIHLKAYLRDWTSCIFGSSNATLKGMGATQCYNLELNGISNNLETKTLIYLQSIVLNSSFMTESLYQNLLDQTNDLPDIVEFEEVDLEPGEIYDEYLISSLPMSIDIQQLFSIMGKEYAHEDEEAVNCAIHDSILYNIPPNLSYEDYKIHLSASFFKSPFIKDLLSFIDENERYFGEVKEWIQTHCSNVPIPSRRDLTGNIQVLYKWIVDLSDGKYVVDRPGYSERIMRAPL